VTPFMRSLTTVFAAGMIGGAGLLIALPSDKTSSPFAATLPDPPAMPCKRQAWPNTDRGCFKRTALRQEAALRGAERAGSPVIEPPQSPEHSPDRAAESAHQRSSVPQPDPAPRDELTRAEPVLPPPSWPPAVTDQPVVGAAGEEANQTSAPPTRAAQRGRSEPPRAVRGNHDNLGSISVMARASDGTRRKIVIRPTSMQDVYYYARRDVAAIEHGAVRR